MNLYFLENIRYFGKILLRLSEEQLDCANRSALEKLPWSSLHYL